VDLLASSRSAQNLFVSTRGAGHRGWVAHHGWGGRGGRGCAVRFCGQVPSACFRGGRLTWGVFCLEHLSLTVGFVVRLPGSYDRIKLALTSRFFDWPPPENLQTTRPGAGPCSGSFEVAVATSRLSSLRLMWVQLGQRRPGIRGYHNQAPSRVSLRPAVRDWTRPTPAAGPSPIFSLVWST